MENLQKKPLLVLEDGVVESEVELLPRLKSALQGIMDAKGEGLKRWPLVRIAKSGCWEALFGCNRLGYSRPEFIGEMLHRFTFKALVGPIPEGLELDHLCRNPRCCNPKHLEPVTHKENLRRGFGWPELNRRKTHCIHGHDLAIHAMKYQRTNGAWRRECRICLKERVRKFAKLNPERIKFFQRKYRQREKAG